MILRLSLIFGLIPGLLAAQGAGDNALRVTAMLITPASGSVMESPSMAALDALGAQTLVVSGPSDAELRSVVNRFADAALNADVALVLVEASVLEFEDRLFIAPEGLTLNRRTDLLTRSVSLTTLARAAALARNGGVVIAVQRDFGGLMPAGITQARGAPMAQTGVSPVLFATASTGPQAIERLASEILTGLTDLAPEINLLAGQDGFDLSQALTRPLIIYRPGGGRRGRRRGASLVRNRGRNPGRAPRANQRLRRAAMPSPTPRPAPSPTAALPRSMPH